jgi:acetylornithine deacetylase/succinyl-diaminopimelate desuccinylase-like protein
MSYVAVDLDGTLAEYSGWRGKEHIGEPVQLMLDRVKDWLAQGVEVKIFTARAGDSAAIPFIEDWLEKHGIPGLEITNIKDHNMIQFWDDRAVSVIPNTGELAEDPSWVDNIEKD